MVNNSSNINKTHNKQWWSTIAPISTKRTVMVNNCTNIKKANIASHLNSYYQLMGSHPTPHIHLLHFLGLLSLNSLTSSRRYLEILYFSYFFLCKFYCNKNTISIVSFNLSEKYYSPMNSTNDYSPDGE